MQRHGTLRIGLDFDNTLISYDELLAHLAADIPAAQGLLDKTAIRDAIRLSEEGDKGWQRLQGLIYGPLIGDAELAPGAAEFLSACRALRHEIHVVSHKTEYAVVDPSRTPLRTAAINWMEKNGIFETFGVSRSNIHFASTFQDKLGLIRDLRPDVFVDDLIEVLAAQDFPDEVVRILYDPAGNNVSQSFSVCRSFYEIRDVLFGRACQCSQ